MIVRFVSGGEISGVERMQFIHSRYAPMIAFDLNGFRYTYLFSEIAGIFNC